MVFWAGVKIAPGNLGHHKTGDKRVFPSVSHRELRLLCTLPAHDLAREARRGHCSSFLSPFPQVALFELFFYLLGTTPQMLL